MIQIFSAHGRTGRTDGTDQPKVVQEVLADLKKTFATKHDTTDFLRVNISNSPTPAQGKLAHILQNRAKIPARCHILQNTLFCTGMATKHDLEDIF